MLRVYRFEKGLKSLQGLGLNLGFRILLPKTFFRCEVGYTGFSV